MLITAISIFALAALGGLGLLLFVLGSKNTPKGMAFIHGFLASAALIVLIIYVCLSPVKPLLSLILFLLAATGGFTLIYRDITNRSIPKWLALGHGLVAVLAFISLIIFVFRTHF